MENDKTIDFLENSYFFNINKNLIINYNQYFKFLNVFNSSDETNFNTSNNIEEFKNIYNETRCKDILNFNIFINVFNNILEHLQNYNNKKYSELFHDNEIISEVNNIFNKISIENCILLNDIFNFLMFDEKLYKNYVIANILYLNFNRDEIEKIKNTDFYNQLNSFFCENILPDLYFLINYDDSNYIPNTYFYGSRHQLRENYLKIISNPNHEYKLLTDEEYNNVYNTYDVISHNYYYENYYDDEDYYDNEDYENDEIQNKKRIKNTYIYDNSLNTIDNLIKKCFQHQNINNKIFFAEKYKEYKILLDLIVFNKYHRHYNEYKQQIIKNGLSIDNNNNSFDNKLLVALNRFDKNNKLFTDLKNFVPYDKERLRFLISECCNTKDKEKNKEKMLKFKNTNTNDYEIEKLIVIAGFFNNFSLVKELVEFYNFQNKTSTNIKYKDSYFSNEIKEYLINFNVIEPPKYRGGGLMNLIAYGA